MSTIIRLSDDLAARAQRRASEAGYPDVHAYVESLVRADADAPEHLAFRTQEELEKKLIEGLDSPVRELGDADWDAMQQRLRGAARGKNGPRRNP